MSDDLFAKMKAAAETAIKESTPAESNAVEETVEASGQEAAPEEQPAETAEGDAPAEEPAAEESDVDAPPVAEAAANDDEDENFAVIQRIAERRIKQFEVKTKLLEKQLAEATQQNEKTREQVAQDIFKKLRRKPAATFKEFGFDFQDLIDAGIRETSGGDDRVVSEIDELREELRALKKDREEMSRVESEKAEAAQLEGARNEFLGMVTKNQFPSLYEWFKDDPHALWDEACRIAEAQGDDDVDDIQVIQHLEKKYRERLGRFNATPLQASQKKQPAKTLSTKAASETRTAGKPFGQLDADQQKAALLAAVKKATSQPAN